MGRATEFFDYLATDPSDMSERSLRWCSFTITDELKSIRRSIRAHNRKNSVDKTAKSCIMEAVEDV